MPTRARALASTTWTEERLLEVIDGLGEEDTSAGYGLSNVDRRIRLYYDQEEGLSIESGPEGTRVSFRVPRKTREEIVDG